MIDRLKGLCDEFRRRSRRWLLWMGTGRLVTVTLMLSAALIAADYWWRFGRLGRWTALVLVLAVAARVVQSDLRRPFRHRWSDGQVLRYLDRLDPAGGDALTNLAELRHGDGVAEAAQPAGRALLQEAVARLEAQAGRRDLAGALRPGPLRRWLALAAATTLAAAVLAVLLAPYSTVGLGRLLMPWAALRWPDSTSFTILEPIGGARVPEGEDVTVRVRIDGRRPDQVTLVYHTIDAAGARTSPDLEVTMFVTTGREARVPVARPVRSVKTSPGRAGDDVREDTAGQARPGHALSPPPRPASREAADRRVRAMTVAEYTFRALSRSVRFYVQGGDGRSRTVDLALVERPLIRAVRAYYKYPPYSSVPPKVAESADLAGLEGTEVRVAFEASQVLASAWIELAGRPGRLDLPLDDSGTRFEWTHRLTESGRYAVGLVDRDGNRERRPETFEIRVTADRPPGAHILEPAGDLDVTAHARIHVAYRAEDDFGLRRVRLMLARNDGQPEPLDEKITGPVRQIGKESAGAFDWDLSTMDLAGVRHLTYHLEAEDVNPTGRGRGESARLRITILSDTELMSRVLLASRALLTEALLGTVNQRWAWLDGQKWLKSEGLSETEQALLRQMEEEQSSARRAAEALKARFAALLAEVERNRMGAAFFDRRLSQLGEAIRQMADERQAAITAALADARPKSAAADTPRGRADLMKKALTDLAPLQKRAALEFAQLLDLLRDWNDLQNVLVKTRRLKELQEDLHRESFVVAPRWIGRELEDLSDPESKLLETLSQQQATIFEAEQALEEELQTLALAAAAQGRQRVFVPLKECLELLRLRGVNDRIIQCARGIRENRVDATLEDQAYVVKVFTFVVAKFEEAGRDVRPIPPVDVAAVIRDDREERVAAAPPPQAVAGETLVFNPESDVDVEDVDAYRVDTIEQAMVFLQAVLENQVLLYTRYTDEKFRKAGLPAGVQAGPAERYRRLRLGMLGVRAGRARDAMDKVLAYAADHDFPEVQPFLQALAEDLASVQGLVESGRTGAPTQAWVTEAAAAVQTCRRALARREQALAQLADRTRGDGRDQFGQPYRVSAADLAALARIHEGLDWAAVLVDDARHKVTRQALEGLAPPAAAQARDRAVARQTRAGELVAAALAEASSAVLPSDLRDRLAREELAALRAEPFAEVLAQLGRGAPPAEIAAAQSTLAETLRLARRNLEALADERVRPVETLTTEVLAAQRAIEEVNLAASPEELAAQIAAAREKALHDLTPEAMARRARQAPLDPRIRALLLKALEDQPDPAVQALIRAYFNQVIPREESED